MANGFEVKELLLATMPQKVREEDGVEVQRGVASCERSSKQKPHTLFSRPALQQILARSPCCSLEITHSNKMTPRQDRSFAMTG